MRDPKQKIILTVLGIVLVVVWTRAFMMKPVYRHNPPPVSFHASGRVVAPRPLAKESPDEEPPVLRWKRDPFAVSEIVLSSGPEKSTLSSGANAKPAAPLRLEGILWDARKPAALINDTLVEVGSSVGGWKVVEIREDRVSLSDGQSTQTLEI